MTAEDIIEMRVKDGSRDDVGLHAIALAILKLANALDAFPREIALEYEAIKDREQDD